jgi:hypothetical protein
MDATRDRLTCSAAQAAAMAGCSYRQLDYWLRTGVIRCHTEASGSGSRRRFTVSDVHAATLVRRLRELDVPLDVVRNVTARLYDSDVEWSGTVVVTRAGDVLDLAEVFTGLHPGVVGYVIDLAPQP